MILVASQRFSNPGDWKHRKGEIKDDVASHHFSVFRDSRADRWNMSSQLKRSRFRRSVVRFLYRISKASAEKTQKVVAQAFMDKGYKVVSGGTDNHCMLIDLRTKFPELTGKKLKTYPGKSRHYDQQKTWCLSTAVLRSRLPVSVSELRLSQPGDWRGYESDRRHDRSGSCRISTMKTSLQKWRKKSIRWWIPVRCSPGNRKI